MTTLFNLGSISSMQVPHEWRPGRIISGERPGQISQPYHLDGDDEVTFATYYRGISEPQIVAEYFKAVLTAPAHKIEQEEYQTLYIVLRHMCEDQFFKIDQLYTRLLGGKMVLVAEGVWLRTELRNLGIFIASDEACSEIDELHYFAPVTKFDNHLSEVMAIIDSIKFREPVVSRGARHV